MFAWVHSGALSDSFRVRLGSLGRAFGSSGSLGFAWDLQARLEVAGFIGVRVGSPRRVYGWSNSFGFASVHSGAPRGHRVHSGSRGFPREGLGDFVFICVRVGSLRRA